MSGNTNEIRTDVNAILDCIDYVCQRLDISQEELDKAYDVFEEILANGVKESVSKALFGDKKRKPYTEYKRVDYNSQKKPYTDKDDWSYELDHLYFDTIEEAKEFITKLEDWTSNELFVNEVLQCRGKNAPFDSRFYGWKRNDIIDHIKYKRIGYGYGYGAQVILPPPVRLVA